MHICSIRPRSRRDRIRRADTTVQGPLSSFNFFHGRTNILRMTLSAVVVFWVAFILWLGLPMLGYNITAGAYVCRRGADGKIRSAGLEPALLEPSEVAKAELVPLTTTGKWAFD